MSSDDVSQVSDPYSRLGFIRNPDGSLTRIPNFIPNSPPSSDPPVLSKDISVNSHNNTFARLYLPAATQSAPSTKLPLIVYFHGGGFVICSAFSTMFQKFCLDLADQIPAVVVSVEYRNAPEHRLPAAYEDCVEALHWIATTEEEWLVQYADLSQCYLMGLSAGGNIVFNVGLRAVVDQLMPLQIRGLIMQSPYFSGAQPTPSEAKSTNDAVLPLDVNYLMWELALPVGMDRDHAYSNPTKAPNYELVDQVKNKGWRVLVTGYRGDPLHDRIVELVGMLKERGVDVLEKIGDGGFHGSDLMDEGEATMFYGVVKKFLLAP